MPCQCDYTYENKKAMKELMLTKADRDILGLS